MSKSNGYLIYDERDSRDLKVPSQEMVQRIDELAYSIMNYQEPGGITMVVMNDGCYDLAAVQEAAWALDLLNDRINIDMAVSLGGFYDESNTEVDIRTQMAQVNFYLNPVFKKIGRQLRLQGKNEYLNPRVVYGQIGIYNNALTSVDNFGENGYTRLSYSEIVASTKGKIITTDGEICSNYIILSSSSLLEEGISGLLWELNDPYRQFENIDNTAIVITPASSINASEYGMYNLTLKDLELQIPVLCLPGISAEQNAYLEPNDNEPQAMFTILVFSGSSSSNRKVNTFFYSTASQDMLPETATIDLNNYIEKYYSILNNVNENHYKIISPNFNANTRHWVKSNDNITIKLKFIPHEDDDLYDFLEPYAVNLDDHNDVISSIKIDETDEYIITINNINAHYYIVGTRIEN